MQVLRQEVRARVASAEADRAHAWCRRVRVGTDVTGRERIRGLPVTGCCWSKGLTGQPKLDERVDDCATPEDAAVEVCAGRAVRPARAPPLIAAARRNIVAMRRLAPRWR